ncbi:protein of unknown function [Rubritalea squalenifaciens DSM 18772]|uniref:GYF domain-containing protein n=1 Tax=Rubritalea squalenifaciens DSM 18772 TaxID=1123071 RepID=A0A1M6HPT5_9BACT|nr:GYF domain-containing protein [Rubritalea squalenifaciens]SHJ24241.1 protein of unknown function [Rubritalea squalenifaciens DSM 18772]
MCDKVWFYNYQGMQHGPMTATDLLAQLAANASAQSGALIWKDGMKQWNKLTEIPELYSLCNKTKTVSVKPSFPSHQTIGTQSKKESDTPEFDGISRITFLLMFFLGIPLIFTLSFILVFECTLYTHPFVIPLDSSIRVYSIFLPLVCMVVALLWMFSARIRNTGYSRWWSLAIFVPFINLWPMLLSFCAGNNFKAKKRLGPAECIFFLLFMGYLSLATPRWTRALSGENPAMDQGGLINNFIDKYIESTDHMGRMDRLYKKWFKEMNKKERTEMLAQIGRSSERMDASLLALQKVAKLLSFI